IALTGSGMVRGNTASKYGIGISADRDLGDPLTVAGSKSFENDSAGIFLAHGAVASGNVAYHNKTGIEGESRSSNEVRNNRVFANSVQGVYVVAGSTVDGNVVYNNPVGVYGDQTSDFPPGPFSGTISNNLIYSSGSQGILIRQGKGAKVYHNTVANYDEN